MGTEILNENSFSSGDGDEKKIIPTNVGGMEMEEKASPTRMKTGREVTGEFSVDIVASWDDDNETAEVSQECEDKDLAWHHNHTNHNEPTNHSCVCVVHQLPCPYG